MQRRAARPAAVYIAKSTFRFKKRPKADVELYVELEVELRVSGVPSRGFGFFTSAFAHAGASRCPGLKKLDARERESRDNLE